MKSQKITTFFTRKNNLKLTIDLDNRIEATFGPRFKLHQNRVAIDKRNRYIQINCDQCLQEIYPRAHISVIGDDLNDIEMVKDFDGYGIIGDHEELIKVAKHLVHDILECIDNLMK